jgi:uncharacterized protein (DUF983 family)
MEGDFSDRLLLDTNSHTKQESSVVLLHSNKYDLLYSTVLLVNVKWRKYLWCNVVVIVIIIIIIITIIVRPCRGMQL